MIVLWLFVQSLNRRVDTKLYVRRFRDSREQINYQVTGTLGSKQPVSVASTSWRVVIQALAQMVDA